MSYTRKLAKDKVKSPLRTQAAAPTNIRGCSAGPGFLVRGND
jgi:hypothetical protein